MCRPCRSAYGREHYEANKQRYIDQARAQKNVRRLARTLFLLDYFAAHPCTDCGERDPVVLEFDHLADKEFDVTQKLTDRNWQAVLDEMRKCEVVCANCHRRRTARRRGALRWELTRQLTRWSGERAIGIEPTLQAWKACVQPLTLRPRRRRV